MHINFNADGSPSKFSIHTNRGVAVGWWCSGTKSVWKAVPVKVCVLRHVLLSCGKNLFFRFVPPPRHDFTSARACSRYLSLPPFLGSVPPPFFYDYTKFLFTTASQDVTALIRNLLFSVMPSSNKSWTSSGSSSLTNSPVRTGAVQTYLFIVCAVYFILLYYYTFP